MGKPKYLVFMNPDYSFFALKFNPSIQPTNQPTNQHFSMTYGKRGSYSGQYTRFRTHMFAFSVRLLSVMHGELDTTIEGAN
jgi:hypothetical protein